MYERWHYFPRITRYTHPASYLCAKMTTVYLKQNTLSMRSIPVILLCISIASLALSSCKETEEQRRVKKAAKEKKLTATVVDSIITYDSLTQTTNVTVEKRELDNIYITPEKPANIYRNDGQVASQFETIRKVSYFISKKAKLPDDLVAQKVRKALLVRFFISKEGRMMGVKLLNPTHTKLDTALLEVVYKLKHTYKWAPATHKGQPVNSQIVIPVKY